MREIFEKDINLKKIKKIDFEKFDEILEAKNFENQIDILENEDSFNLGDLNKTEFFCGFNNILNEHDFLVLNSFFFNIVEDEIKITFDSRSDDVLI